MFATKAAARKDRRERLAIFLLLTGSATFVVVCTLIAAHR